MCGITGAVDFDRPPVDRATLEHMTRTMTHRGPDEEGFFLDGSAALGMRRLSIIDVAGSHQPMANEDGSVQMVFNGEIYNYRGLRDELLRRGHRFANDGDTETIVHAYEEYGLNFVQHLNGMFAIAIWDADARRLVLARDRLGIKPLYHSADNRRIVFGSEPKAILASGLLEPEVDPLALQAYLALRYVPAPLAIFRGMRKLPAAHLLVFDRDGCREIPYWDVDFEPRPGTSERRELERFQELFDDAVRKRLISDVPLGAFLSGGLDSSGIVASMAQASLALGNGSRPKTFSIGFEEQGFDERRFARRVAADFGTEHFEGLATARLGDHLEELAYFHDEPFADPASLPTLLLSRHTREHVTVALSGDGGDEIFAGYDRYYSERLADVYGRVPAALRRSLVNPALELMVAALPVSSRLRRRGDAAVKKARLSFLPPAERYLAHFDVFSGYPAESIWSAAVLPQLRGHGAADYLAPHMEKGGAWDPLGQRLYTDLKTWLPEQMLTKVDRMSMAASLEVRVPFLDHRLVEFAAGLPADSKLGWFSVKKFLRKASRSRLPPEIWKRRKHGFAVPLDHWFRGELRALLEAELAPDRIERQGVFQPDFVRSLVEEHAAGQRNHGSRLFSLLTFSLWHRRWIEGPSEAVS
ncbi:MAG: asparagine synthase (glutamine-hydrolyzing) [Thermoanaerobaculia bacterium]